jgi:hypothetical protein
LVKVYRVFDETDVRKVTLPRYGNITVKKIWSSIGAASPIWDYLPWENWQESPLNVEREFLLNVINTVTPGYSILRLNKFRRIELLKDQQKLLRAREKEIEGDCIQVVPQFQGMFDTLSPNCLGTDFCF